MGKVLGLDLGTNSIGWAVIDTIDTDNHSWPERLCGLGSRIIPMTQDDLDKFGKGESVSRTSERTRYRGVRRLRERHLLRRERLLRVLHLMNFLPDHYDKAISWDMKNYKTFAKVLGETDERGRYQESKLAWRKDDNGKYVFLFQHSFEEMINDFRSNGIETRIPYDWTIYYLRKKALSAPVSKEELAWILLQFNQKRGYNQLRGEEEEIQEGKTEEYHALQVIKVTKDEEEDPQKEGDLWYNIELENGWIYRRKSKVPLFNWEGLVKEFIVTTENKKDEIKRSFRAPKEDDWTLIKKKTESDLEKSGKTVGGYIYDKLLETPDQKVRGDLIRTIERKYYKHELLSILEKQKEFHMELTDKDLYEQCVRELYPQNEAHVHNVLSSKNLFTGLFVTDILFYQRPLKSKKSLIQNCQYETRVFYKEGQKQEVALKGIAKSNPLFQEFRLWKFIRDLRIYERTNEIDVTNQFIKSNEAYEQLFNWLNEQEKIKQDTLFGKYFKLKKTKDQPFPYRWKYPEDKEYPCNETRAQMLKCGLSKDILTQELETSLWHILYSVEDPAELEKALRKFKEKHEGLPENFVEQFRKIKPYKKDYGSYSEKAIKKLLPHLREGEGEHKACVTVYNRYAEASEIRKWSNPSDIEDYLKKLKQHSLRNPVVEQVVTETLRVVKDIWERYGDLSEIHVELGREMKNPANKRERITKQIAENEKNNLRIKEILTEELKHQPSLSELERYKIWEEQGKCSIYTGNPIDFCKLFTHDYQIDHIIPQARYYDDSLSNKVICEAEVNKLKGAMLGYEFIQKSGGTKISLNFGESKTILTEEEYTVHVRQIFGDEKYRKKRNYLLSKELPADFNNRQLNDTRYITKLVKGLLSNIVREEGEKEATSKHVILCTGGVTTKLKEEWGLNDVWNRIIQSRFERLNGIDKTQNYGEWKENRFRIQVPLELQKKGFNKKRIDHRHHALDALVIACATKRHVNFLNNTRAANGEERQDLKHKLCLKSHPDAQGNYHWQFRKPWDRFTEDTQTALEKTVVSFKQNLRVIGKTKNKYQVFDKGKKVIIPQKQGDNWAIRKPLHKETIYAQVSLRREKTIRLSEALKDWKKIIDKNLKDEIRNLFLQYGGFTEKNEQLILKYFKDREYKFKDVNISKVEVYYDNDANAATRKRLDTSFDEKRIKDSIIDINVRNILLNHLQNKEGNPEIAFSIEGIEEMNRNIERLNNGKPHQPIYKVKVYGTLGNKFPVGYTKEKRHKYVVAEKGTNLFFAIYHSTDGSRQYETIPLKIAIERQKERIEVAPEIWKQDPSYQLLFVLSPGDLVYVPNEKEEKHPSLVNFSQLTDEQERRIYRFVNSSDASGSSRAWFVPHTHATPVRENEMGPTINSSADKDERMVDFGKAFTRYDEENKPIMIKSCCWKIRVDRLGKIDPNKIER
jgi:CRISPR-associated endonuclease Csn1